ncbi:MAG: murein biosynthesis integral membrane protein MurJ [Acidobacteriota bacterium]|nr:murein biosynthesis integral membrane protein MurJ [Acidobacteriota bacterium]
MADIAKGVRSFTLGTALSRVLGLVREMVINHLFGAGLANDAFRAAFRIPNLLRDLFAENALSSAFVPVLTEEKKKGREAENRFASNILNTLLLVVGLITLLGMLAARPLAGLMAHGFDKIPGKLALTGQMTAVMFPFLLFIALAAWAMSVLNTNGSFFVPAVAPAMFNIFSFLTPLALFAYLTGRGVEPVLGAAIGVMTGGLMQFLVQVPGLRRSGFRYRPVISFRDPAFRRAMALFVPVAIGLSGSRISFFVNTMLISSLPQKSLTWLDSAYRIMHLPLGLFGIAIGAVALPSFSRFAAEGDTESVRSTLQDSLRMVLFLTVPTSVLIAALAGPITSLIYVHGRFTAADGSATAAILVLYMIGVPFMSAMRNLASVFFAHKDAKTPMYISFIAVGLTIVLNLSLMGWLGIRAFPLSATISAAVNAGLLFVLLPRKIGSLQAGPLFLYLGRMILASVCGGGATWGMAKGAAAVLGQGRLALFGLIVVAGLAGAAVFYGAALLLGLTEVKSYVRRFLRV